MICVVTYHRVSTADQDPAGARAELEAAAGRLGRIVDRIEETGSGARHDRPGLRRIMELAQRGRIEAVVVWKLDRFGRSALDVLANLRELEARGVRFIASSQGIDVAPGGDAMSRLLLTMLAAVAEFERELISERTRLGLEAARARGTRLGRPPLELPDRARVKRLRRKGLSWRAIAAELECSQWAARKAAGDV